MYPAPSATNCQIATFRQREMMETGQRERRVASVGAAPVAAPGSESSQTSRLGWMRSGTGLLLRWIRAHAGRGCSFPGSGERGAVA